MVKLVVYDNGQKTLSLFEFPKGTSLDLVLKKGVLPIKHGCLRGECGTCLVKVNKGNEFLGKPSKEEVTLVSQLKKQESGDLRLACQCLLNGDVEVSPVSCCF